MDNTRFHQNFILCQILMVINVVAQLYAISVTFHASRFDGLSRPEEFINSLRCEAVLYVLQTWGATDVSIPSILLTLIKNLIFSA